MATRQLRHWQKRVYLCSASSAARSAVVFALEPEYDVARPSLPVSSLACPVLSSFCPSSSARRFLFGPMAQKVTSKDPRPWRQKRRRSVRYGGRGKFAPPNLPVSSVSLVGNFVDMRLARFGQIDQISHNFLTRTKRAGRGEQLHR